jgi:hypothetical protein
MCLYVPQHSEEREYDRDTLRSKNSKSISRAMFKSSHITLKRGRYNNGAYRRARRTYETWGKTHDDREQRASELFRRLTIITPR